MTKPHHLAALALAAAACAAQADADTRFVFDLAAPAAITQVAPAGTAELLAGARALAFFNDGSSAEAAFVVTTSGAQAGALAQAPAFFVNAFSDASLDVGRPREWSVANTDASRTLLGFAIDLRNGGLGQAAFDIHFGPSLNEAGTPGSNAGSSLLMDFALRSFIKGSSLITYSQPLALAGAPAVGDLFGRVDVLLGYSNAGLNGGLLPNSSLSSQNFSSDLDAVVYAPVPEPTSAALLLVGGLGLVAGARRRRG